MASLGRHSLAPLRHWEHLGFCSSPVVLDESLVEVESQQVEQVKRCTFQFPRTTCQTASKTKIQLVIGQSGWSEWRGQIYQPVRDRIAKKTALLQHGQNEGGRDREKERGEEEEAEERDATRPKR